jgi:hypothetical protein
VLLLTFASFYVSREAGGSGLVEESESEEEGEGHQKRIKHKGAMFGPGHKDHSKKKSTKDAFTGAGEAQVLWC